MGPRSLRRDRGWVNEGKLSHVLFGCMKKGQRRAVVSSSSSSRPHSQPTIRGAFKEALHNGKRIDEDVDDIIDVQGDSSPPTPRKVRPAKPPFDEHTFGGLLTAAEADRRLTTPGPTDVRHFNASLAAVRTVPIQPPSPSQFNPSITSTAERKRSKLKKDEFDPANPLFRMLHFGGFKIQPWFSAPFPAEYFETTHRQLWMCEYCLKYMRARELFVRHTEKCANRRPPGMEIYRKDAFSLFEVNGRFAVDYCRRLCLLGKLFLDHKLIYNDVETFLFYILVEWKPITDEQHVRYLLKCTPSYQLLPLTHELVTWKFIGYFSKEKSSPSNYNLSCIITLPQHQRRGLGALLMDLSYLLSRREGRLGSPEKPLSDLGLLGYVRYWSSVVAKVVREALQQGVSGLSIQSICEATGMVPEDVVDTLKHLKVLCWDPKTGRHLLCPQLELLKEHSPLRLAADPVCLRWVPYTCSR